MYSSTNILRNVQCNATSRREKHIGIRKAAFQNRKEKNEKLRKSLSSIAKEERGRLDSLWDSHKRFFSNESTTTEKSNDPIVIDVDDLNSSNGFFENTD